MSKAISDRTLISHVKKYPELYNFNHPLYVDGVRRRECWRQIAKELNSKDSVVKLRWCRLRDNFRKAINTRKQREGKNGRKIRHHVKYSEELNFLTPFFQGSTDKDPESDYSPVQDHIQVVTIKDNLSSADENTSEEVINNRQTNVLINDVKLIENVEKYEELYNPANIFYEDQVRRDAIWNEIGTTVGYEADICKDRWASLQDRYRKEITERQHVYRLGDTKPKPIAYDKHNNMKFLIPYLNIEDKGQSDEENDDDLEDSLIDGPLYEDPAYKVQNSELDERNLLAEEIQTIPRRLSICIEPTISSFEPISTLKYSNLDPLTDFFLTMAKTTKTFPVEEQLRIKMELFQLVINTELQLVRNVNGTQNK